MNVYDKIVMSEREPLNINALWFKNDPNDKGIYKFGASGWEKVCDFDGSTIDLSAINEALKEINTKVDSLEGAGLKWIDV